MNILIVIDMQNAVFQTSRYQKDAVVGRINQLIDAAERTLFILHVDEAMQPGSEGWQLLPELHRPKNAIYINKTACDAFYRTELAATLEQLGGHHFTVCGCATDYCVDATIKNAASRGYAQTVAADAHTTADRRAVSAAQLIAQHNEVWADFIIPGNRLWVKETQRILQEWDVKTGDSESSLPAV
ncbi:isochorismatase family protein [Musicola paradisiaca]|uniref:Isochorismatase hydrolase n=1 Tax=Musicola paradisiaca (strain Ech703) TaxID=579405 RepID=C6CAF7_MUSP7|nr:isochorismatase family protein [Musicola paradisiaca]ACS86455.1 isochorismatase hydrolase [Musicola paradisiaca Ech703]